MKENIFEMREQIGDQHHSANLEAPLKSEPFMFSNTQKIPGIAHHFAAIMDIMRLDLTEDSLKVTPYRVAKMYANELFCRLLHVAYIRGDKVISLSKINRIVKYYVKRPQVYERLTPQIFKEICEVTGSPDVMVLLNAGHMCVSMRGAEDKSINTTTMIYNGKFEQYHYHEEFLNLIKIKSYARI